MWWRSNIQGVQHPFYCCPLGLGVDHFHARPDCRSSPSLRSIRNTLRSRRARYTEEVTVRPLPQRSGRALQSYRRSVTRVLPVRNKSGNWLHVHPTPGTREASLRTVFSKLAVRFNSRKQSHHIQHIDPWSAVCLPLSSLLLSRLFIKHFIA